MEISNLGQLVQHLAKKAGIASDNEHLINVLSNAELSKISVHSDLTSGIDNNLLSLTQALDNHPKVKGKYVAEAMNGVDARINAAMEEAGLSDEQKETLLAEKNTYKRLEQLVSALKDTAAKSSTTNEDKSALQKQIEELAAAAKKAKADAAAEIEKAKNQFTEKLKNVELQKLFANVKTIYDELPPKTRMAAIMEHVENTLQDKKAAFTLDENDTLTLVGEGGTAVLGANHTPYTPASLVDETLAQNKILKVTEKPDTNHRQQGNGAERVREIDASNPALKGNNQTIANLNKKALEAFENSQLSQA